MIYFQLIYEFFKIGLFAIGGGMATLPFLMDLTERYDWYTKAELTNMIAISQSTPGPVGINMATYAGYNAAGVFGAITATLALTAPALVIIMVIAKFLADFSENKAVQAAFYGIRPAVAALIGYAVWELVKISLSVTNGSQITGIDYPGAFICLASFGIMQIKYCRKLHPLVWIAAGAIIGILLKL
ncbi:MAG: chromate transporter [Dorea sp.]|nr:chromate transporter [Dorea sp.]